MNKTSNHISAMMPPIVTATTVQAPTTQAKVPVFRLNNGDAELSIIQRNNGRLGVRISKRIPRRKYAETLTCGISAQQLLSPDASAGVGDVILAVSDMLSPEKCASRGYRDDGLGYQRMLAIQLAADDGTTDWSISCIHIRRNGKGQLQRADSYEKCLGIRLSPVELAALQGAVRDFVEIEQPPKQSFSTRPSWSRPWQGATNHG